MVPGANGLPVIRPATLRPTWCCWRWAMPTRGMQDCCRNWRWNSTTAGILRHRTMLFVPAAMVCSPAATVVAASRWSCGQYARVASAHGQSIYISRVTVSCQRSSQSSASGKGVRNLFSVQRKKVPDTFTPGSLQANAGYVESLPWFVRLVWRRRQAETGLV